jgi:hypothetical protein
MKKLNKGWIVAVAVAVTFASLGFKASASLIDLGERDLASKLANKAQTEAYIEAAVGLPPGTLTYLNSFDSDSDSFKNDGTVDSSHLGMTLTDGGVNGLVSWDLATTGWQMSYVFLKDGKETKRGPYLYHLYGVTPDEVFNSNGDQFITINGIRKITYLTFWGVAGSPVPEGGATAMLFALGLGAIELVRRFRLHGPRTA